MTEYELVLKFDTDDPEFARGFRLGIIWESMKTEQAIDSWVRTEDMEMIMRMAEAEGWTFSAGPDDVGGFTSVLMERP